MLHILAMENEQMHQYDTLDLTGTKGRACLASVSSRGGDLAARQAVGRWQVAA
jgi:hypothetical protein